MKLKIISDGTLSGTKVVNADTNEAVENIVSADWSIGVDQVPRIRLELLGISVDTIGVVTNIEKKVSISPQEIPMIQGGSNVPAWTGTYTMGQDVSAKDALPAVSIPAQGASPASIPIPAQDVPTQDNPPEEDKPAQDDVFGRFLDLE